MAGDGDHRDGPVEFRLVLRPVRDELGRTPEYRLRRSLKVLLRSFGLKCVWVGPNRPDPRAQSSGDEVPL